MVNKYIIVQLSDFCGLLVISFRKIEKYESRIIGQQYHDEGIPL